LVPRLRDAIGYMPTAPNSAGLLERGPPTSNGVTSGVAGVELPLRVSGRPDPSAVPSGGGAYARNSLRTGTRRGARRPIRGRGVGGGEKALGGVDRSVAAGIGTAGDSASWSIKAPERGFQGRVRQNSTNSCLPPIMAG